MKKQLGQFFTTNSDYILQGFEEFVKNKEVADPFAGDQDLISWAEKNNCKKAIGFDCDKNYVDNKKVFYNDSLLRPRKYKFVCTNPPYLHKNKADKGTKDKFFSGQYAYFEDLYQISIFSILNCEEGILIVPLNFLCAENSQKMRNLFFNKFEIIKLNIFTKPVFDDTTYNVISFYFKRKRINKNQNRISAIILPKREEISFSLEKRSGWRFGGEFTKRIKKTKNNLGIFRFTEKFLEPGSYETKVALQNIKNRTKLKISSNTKSILDKNIIFLRAIDSKNGKKIQLEDIRKYDISGLIGKNTSRNMAHLIFKQDVPIGDQEILIKEFNDQLNQNRKRYFSFFLTNFRDNNRKRISFNFTYKLLNYIYNEKYTKQSRLF